MYIDDEIADEEFDGSRVNPDEFLLRVDGSRTKIDSRYDSGCGCFRSGRVRVISALTIHR